jgi:hypothetical protein
MILISVKLANTTPSVMMINNTVSCGQVSYDEYRCMPFNLNKSKSQANIHAWELVYIVMFNVNQLLTCSHDYNSVSAEHNVLTPIALVTVPCPHTVQTQASEDALTAAVERVTQRSSCDTA